MPALERDPIKQLKKACDGYKKIVNDNIDYMGKKPTWWVIDGWQYVRSDEEARRLIVKEYGEKGSQEKVKASERYTGEHSLINGRPVLYTEKEKNDIITKFEKKIAIIDRISECLNNNNLEEAAKEYINARDILEEDVSKKELPTLGSICLLALLVTLSSPFIPVLLVIAAIMVPLSFIFPSDEDKHPSDQLTDLMKETLRKNIPLALENECLVFKKQLEKKRSIYENKLQANSLSPKIQTKLKEKIDRTSEKINSLKELLKIFQNNELTDTEKWKKFTDKFEEIQTNPKHPLAEKKNARVKLFLHTIGHILAAAATLGIYAGVRAAYAHDARGTLKFWHGKKDIFKENVGEILKKPQPK